MTDAPWCDLCELPLAQCYHGVQARQADLPIQRGPTIEANTTSPCDECGDKIHPMEMITYTDIGWIHDHHEMVRKERKEPMPDNPGDLMEGL